MPLYEYRCAKCAQTIEVMRKFSDPPLTEHEGCGGALERLLSAPAFQLKGTGWYATDYAKSGTKAAADTESKSADAKGSDSKDSSKKADDSKSSGDTTGDKGGDKADNKATESKKDTKTDSKPAATPSKSD